MGPFAECHSTVNPEVYQKVLGFNFFVFERIRLGLLILTPERTTCQSGGDAFITILLKPEAHYTS